MKEGHRYKVRSAYSGFGCGRDARTNSGFEVKPELQNQFGRLEARTKIRFEGQG